MVEHHILSERDDSRVESQFLRVHVASSTADNANERLEVIFTLEIVVLRDHPASTIKQTDVEDGSTKSDTERVAHERTSGEVETSDVYDLAENRFDFGCFACRLLRSMP